MRRRRATVLLTIAVLSGALAGTQLPAQGTPPEIAPLRSDRTVQPQVVDLGGGDRVAVTRIGHGRRTVEPLPGRDGTSPGLILETSDQATTVVPTDGEAAPTVIAGRPSPSPAAATELVPLRFESIGRDGRPAHGFVSVYDVETGSVSASRRIPGDPAAECSSAGFGDSSCVLVPPGTYSVMAFVNTNPAGDPSTRTQRTAQSVSLVGDPELPVTTGTTYTLDARKAVRVEVRTPGHRTSVAPGGAMQLGFRRTAANGRSINPVLRPASLLEETFYLQPTDPVTIGRLETLTRIRLEAPDIEMTAAGLDLTPEYYEAVWFSDVSSDFPVLDGRAELRVADVGHAAPEDLAGRDLSGAIALAERSDALSVAEQSNAAAAAGAELVAIYNDVPGDSGDPNGTGTKLQVPTVRLSRAEGTALRALPAGAVVGVRGESASPYLYDLVLKEHGGIPQDLSRVFRKDQLARQVRRLHGQPGGGSTYSETAFHYQPGDRFAISTSFPFRGAPRERVEYRIPDADTRWTYSTVTPETRYNALFPEEPVLRMQLNDPGLRAYTAPGRTVKPAGAAPVTSRPSRFRPIQRSGDLMRVAIDGFVDADGNFGPAYTDDSGMRTLLQVRADGALVGETEYLPSGVVALPPGKSTVEVSFETDNPQPWARLSTHTETTWTFPSRTGTADQVTQPVIVADYDADVDLRNHLAAPGRAPELDLHLAHAASATAAPFTEVTVEASYDDGRTWRPAEVSADGGDGYHAELPPGSGFLSLRLHAADGAGSVLDQTVIRALVVD